MPRRHRFAAAIAAVAVAAVLLVTLTVAVVTHGDGAFAPPRAPAGAGPAARRPAHKRGQKKQE